MINAMNIQNNVFKGKKAKKEVLWDISIPEEVVTEYTGVKLSTYYNSPEVMLEAQLRAKEIFNRFFNFTINGIAVTYSSYVEASMLGVEIIFPQDNVPMVKRPVLKDIKDVDKLKVLNPYREGLMSRVVNTYRYMKKKVGNKIPISFSATEGPITTAVIVRGQDFFTDLYLYPREAHKLLGLITEVSLMLREVTEKVTETTMKSTGISDDFSGLLSPEQYEEFALPYQKRIYDVFGKEGRRLHSELLRKGHLKFLERLKVTHYDPGTDQYLSIRDIIDEVNIPFSWNLKPSEDVLQGTPQSIKTKYEQAVAEGAGEIITELCRGIPQENIQAFIEVARKYEGRK